MSEVEKPQLTAAQEAVLKQNVLKTQAVRQAMFEVVGEQRAEIVRRARAKLTAMGVQLEESDFTL